MTQTLKMIRVLNLPILITPLPQRISCIAGNHPGISIPVIQSSTRSTHTRGHYKQEYQAFQRPLRLCRSDIEFYIPPCAHRAVLLFLKSTRMIILFVVKQSVFKPLMYLSQMLYFLKKSNSIK